MPREPKAEPELGYYYFLLKKSGDTYSVIWVGERINVQEVRERPENEMIDDRAGTLTKS